MMYKEQIMKLKRIMYTLQRLFRRTKQILMNCGAECRFPDKSPKEIYREIKINGILYCLTSVFEGNKDIDKTLERLAIKKVASSPASTTEDIDTINVK